MRKPLKHTLLIYHDKQSWEGITEAERQQIYGIAAVDISLNADRTTAGYV